MDNVITFARTIARQHETATILFFIGIAALLAFAFVREILRAFYVFRARPQRKIQLLNLATPLSHQAPRCTTRWRGATATWRNGARSTKDNLGHNHQYP
jgi:hypothetical protein